MQLDLPTRRRRYPSLTSLIDIIFLLLLFFMLSSTFSKFTEIDVSAGQSGSGTTSEQPKVFIAVDGSEFRVNGQSGTLATLPELLEPLKEGENLRAIVRVSEETNSQFLIDLVDALARADVKPILVR